MNVLHSGELFKKLMIDYLEYCEEEESPKLAGIKFKDLIPELEKGFERCKALSNEYLYQHQYEALNALMEGKNVILKSGTGSGKTEAWAIYALKNKVKALVIYPTLALSADQIHRLYEYYSSLRLENKVVQLDRPTVNRLGTQKIKYLITNSLLVITNPAFLLSELKRIAMKQKTFLKEFLKDVDLIIIDELDFYGSKGANLLIVMIELLSKYLTMKNPQIVILTATLANTKELVNILNEVTGRDTKVIEGKAFKVRNCNYLILGKNIEELRSLLLKKYLRYIDSELVKKIIKSKDKFMFYVHDILGYLREKGFKELPLPYLDIGELLSYYVKYGDGITLVFAPSIRTAEKIVKKVRELLEYNEKEKIYSHHHLIPKHVRRKIEENARVGNVKVIVTVRTLLQGIDLGNVVRVIHYGIPLDIRELKQREGRKGRRKYIPFTESIYVPIFESDRKLVSLGINEFQKYIELPLENVVINLKNKYVLLFKALFKIIYGTPLSHDEERILKELNLVKEIKTLTGITYVLNDEGNKVWNEFNFYEFGPPYGYIRLLRINNEIKPIDEVSKKDYIYNFQPGCFDLSSESIVTEISARKIYLDGVDNAIRNYSYLESAYDYYTAIKYRWGEVADIKNDLVKGNLVSKVNILTFPPQEGFGKIIEKPLNVQWIVESSKPKFRNFLNTIIVTHERESIVVSTKTKGHYEDFTYGYKYETEVGDDPELLRVGLAFIKLILRLSPKYRLSIHELNYSIISTLPHQPLIYLWEHECSGVTKLINWDDVRKEINSFNPSPLASILLWFIDEDASRYIMMKELSWDDVKKASLKVLNYIEGVTYLRLKDFGLIKVPKPSKDLNLVSTFIADVELINLNKTIYVISKFDGKKCLTYTTEAATLDGIPYDLVENAKDLISEIIENNLLLITAGDELIKICNHSRICKILLKELMNNGNLYDVINQGKRKLNVDLLTLRDISKLLNFNFSVDPLEIIKLSSEIKYEKSKRKEELIKLIKKYSCECAKLIYMFYLVLSHVKI